MAANMQNSNQMSLRQAFEHFVRIVRLIQPYWSPLWKGMYMGVVIGLVGLIPPYLSKTLIDEVLPSKDVGLMQVVVMGILTLTIAMGFLGILRGYYTLYVGSRLGNAISLMFFNHLQHLPVRFFDEHRVGEILSRFQDVRNSLNTVTNVFQTVFLNGVYLIVVPPFLFFLQWKLALIALAGIPLTTAVTMVSGRILRKYWKRTAEAFASLSAFQYEVLSNIRTLKAFAIESHIFERGRANTLDAQRLQLQAASRGQAFGFITSIIRALNTAIFTWYGWSLILSGGMTLGEFIAFTAYTGYLYSPVSHFVGLLTEFQQSSVSFARMFEYLDLAVEQPPQLAYEAQKPIGIRLKGEIHADGISFGYVPDRLVLRSVTLTMPKGGSTAIIGPSGSGKTSLLRLLLRMENTETGEILIDGNSIRNIPLSDLRRQIAVVWQEIGLLPGTIWENLTLGVDSPQRPTVEEAIRMCKLDELVKSLPNGLESNIAEWGASMSAGQRQRLAIARALVRDAPILLLDEATANIDVETESEILRELMSFMRSRTFVFVTHRLASAALADQVCILDDGRVVGVGSHQKLMSENELYRKLFSLPISLRENRAVRTT